MDDYKGIIIENAIKIWISVLALGETNQQPSMSDALSLLPRSKIKDRLKPDSTYKIVYDNTQQDDPRFILAYWSIRGLAAPLRMMLAAAEVNHWVVMYDVTEKEDGKWGKDSCLADKEWLKEEYHPLMNLPFLVDCSTDCVIVQTNAIFFVFRTRVEHVGENYSCTIQV